MADIKVCDRCGKNPVKVRKGNPTMLEITIPQAAPCGEGGTVTGDFTTRIGVSSDSDLCRPCLQAGAAVYITLPDVDPTPIP